MIDSYKSLVKIRRSVFKEVARIGFENPSIEEIESLPYKLLNADTKKNGQAKYRESIFLERAIISERIRVAMGLPVRCADNYTLLTDGIHEAKTSNRYYEPPLVNIIDFACNACPRDSYYVTDACVGCLANPCANVCPKNAISIINGRSIIDQDLCIKCGKCKNVCPYSAIVHRERPCEKSCGMDAIESDEFGKAKINYDKCVSCGMCLVNCPFGAIVDKSQIYQTALALKSEEVYAIIAPAFVGQFGPKVTLKNINNAMKALGFKGTYEVSIGADLCTIAEAHDFLENVPEKLKFMGTSCCPSWSVMAKKEFPEYKDNISMTLTPMVFTARLVKKEHPNAKIAFIGPCAAKKLEAGRKSVRSDVDFVLTFEELMGMFEAKNVDLNKLQDDPISNITSGDGRGFAVAGGVAQAVVNVIKDIDPTREVNVVSAKGLKECKQMLNEAVKGKYDGCLLEGMACPMGCISGAGTINQPNKTKAFVTLAQKETPLKHSSESKFKDLINLKDN